MFSVLACIVIPYAGLEADEALFTRPFYSPFDRSYGVTICNLHIPLMVFSYVGSLKSLIWWPVLSILGPNVWSMRVPAIVCGALTVAVVFQWVLRTAGLWTAGVVSLLLATDPSFILTNTFDWGPVVIQHFLLATACLLFVARRWATGSFFLGLALWNKAIFIWALAGLTAGALTVCLPQLRRAFADRGRVVRCLTGFALGALPLIIYNIHSSAATARANIHPSFQGIETKLASLRGTMDGSILFGIVTDRTEGSPAAPRSAHGRLSRALERISGRHEHSLFAYGVIFAFVSAPLWWRSRSRSVGLFAIVFLAVAFLSMAAVRYTGAAHHAVLLYPMPQVLVAVALAALRPRWLAEGLVSALLIANLLVVNEYNAQLDRYGAHGLFTDALNPLSESVAAYTGKTIYPLDYGIGESLSTLRKGRLNMQPDWNIPPMPKDQIRAMIRNPEGLFIGRLPAKEYYRGTTERLNSVAQALGYQRRLLQTVQDSNGRPQFQLFEFTRRNALNGRGR